MKKITVVITILAIAAVMAILSLNSNQHKSLLAQPKSKTVSMPQDPDLVGNKYYGCAISEIKGPSEIEGVWSKGEEIYLISKDQLTKVVRKKGSPEFTTAVYENLKYDRSADSTVLALTGDHGGNQNLFIMNVSLCAGYMVKEVNQEICYFAKMPSLEVAKKYSLSFIPLEDYQIAAKAKTLDLDATKILIAKDLKAYPIVHEPTLDLYTKQQEKVVADIKAKQKEPALQKYAGLMGTYVGKRYSGEAVDYTQQELKVILLKDKVEFYGNDVLDINKSSQPLQLYFSTALNNFDMGLDEDDGVKSLYLDDHKWNLVLFLDEQSKSVTKVYLSRDDNQSNASNPRFIWQSDAMMKR